MIGRLVRLVALACFGLGAFAHGASAQPMPVEEVPPALRPWVPWALDAARQSGTFGCARRDVPRGGAQDANPNVQDANAVVGASAPFVCTWPGELALYVDAAGGHFTFDVTSDGRGPLSLPGGGPVWPEGLRVDGHDAVVLAVSGVPTVWLEPGAHRLEGRFVWSTPPETLRVPADAALVFVERDGVRSAAARGASGEVWLRGTRAEATAEDDVGLEVHRRLLDGAPMTLETHVLVRAAGRPRELTLGRVLPDGVVPIEIAATLPVRLATDGTLTLQLRAGTFELTIRGLAASPERSFERPDVAAPWPAQEVWVWQPDEAFRQVELRGAPGVDPQRTSLPEAWRSLAAFLLDDAATLELRTVRRGEGALPPSSVTIDREAWLDADGRGVTVRDTLGATLHGEHRLELLEGDLGRVSLDGTDQLITRRSEGGHPGVELRRVASAIVAEWKLDGGARIPAVNWSEDASAVSTVLHVPPGWSLVHAGGVDAASGTWLGQWTLLGMFGLLLVSVVVGRVFGPAWGGVAFVGLGLGFHEQGTPVLVWLLLATLAALHRALASDSTLTRAFAGRWVERVSLSATSLTYAALALFAVVSTVSFATTQARIALYPQLAVSGTNDVAFFEEEALVEDYEAGSLGSRSAPLSAAYDGTPRAQTPSWIDPNAVVQTGFGVPRWSGTQYVLGFDGPVAAGHDIELWLLPPVALRAVALLRAAALLALLVLVLRKRPRSPSGDASGPAAAAVAVAVALMLVPTSGRAQAAPSAAATPDPALLTELTARLTRTTPCGDRCSEATMEIHVEGDALRLVLHVSAADAVAYPLPGPSEAWTPSTVTLDGSPSRALVRLEQGFLHVRVPAGAHTVVLEGTLAGRDAVTLAFGRVPRALAIDASGWEAVGHTSDEGIAESVQLRRTLESTSPLDATHDELATWFEVERHLELGVRWTVETIVRRRSPANAPTVVRVPLLPGESVTDGSFVVERAHGDAAAVVVTFGQRDVERHWTSVLAPVETLTLTASPPEARSADVWMIACTPLWHCASDGIAPTASESSAGLWAPTFRPWPGEVLSLTATRPLAEDGQSATVDDVHLRVTPGTRLVANELTATVRTSVTTPFTVEIPSSARIDSVSVDGAARPIQREGDVCSVALQPGSHEVRIAWQSDGGFQTLFETPRVRLGLAAANVSLDVRLSSERWVLWLAGPAWGPALLFWPYLAIVIAGALALSRRRSIPLDVARWLLVLVGLTQIPVLAAAVVVLWFFAVEHRRSVPLTGMLFVLRQAGLVAHTFFALACLAWAVRAGLLGEPDMQVMGDGSDASLAHFFVDRSDGVLPRATLVSIPVEVFRIAMFVWSIGLATSLVQWARWGWSSFREGGLWFPDPGPNTTSEPAKPTEPASSSSASTNEAKAPETEDAKPSDD